MTCNKCGKKTLALFAGNVCAACYAEPAKKTRSKAEPPASTHYRVRRFGKIVHVRRRKVSVKCN